MYKFLFEYLFSGLFGIYIGVELSDYILILCLTFWITIKIFSTASILFYIPTSSEWESNLHVLISSYYFPFYYYCCWYASGCEMGSHGSFDFTIANLSLQWCRRSFCVFSSLAKTLFKWSSKLWILKCYVVCSSQHFYMIK